MAGGLLQVITSGTQDLSLTGNPQITFFHTIYRRYTNFGKKFIELSFDNSPDFGITSYINIPKNNGDLMSKSILKIKLPKVDLSNLNQLINQLYLNNNSSNSLNSINGSTLTKYINEGLPYYNYFISFINNLKNLINIFFNKYDSVYNYLSYIQDLKKYILKYINIDQYNQFFNSINYFYNQIDNIESKYNINLYINASLFYLKDDQLIYVYEKFTNNYMSYIGFKFTIQKNMEILENVNVNIYNKILKDSNSNINDIKFCWVNKIGMYLFNSIDLYIGSNKIYSLSDTYINNYSELYYKNKKLYNTLIGNNSDINVFSNIIDETFLYLPIPFWHLYNYGLAFPLISLQFNSLQIKINTKKLIDCIRIDMGTNTNSSINNDIVNLIITNIDEIVKSKLEITLILEYIYLDSIERNKFARSAHEYLIEQVQQIEFNNISNSNNMTQLDIFHCCKDMFWFIQKIPTTNDIFSVNPNVFNYTYQNLDFINLSKVPNKITIISYLSVLYNPNTIYNPFIFNDGIYFLNNNLKNLEELTVIFEYASGLYSNILSQSQYVISLASNFYLNGTQLFSETYKYFNYLQPYAYYNSSPQLGLNTYSFCLNPTEFQPTGSCNMSRISFIGLKNKINEEVLSKFLAIFLKQKNNQNNKYKLIFQTRNYNVLRIIGGIGATAYTYN
jgi:hypothetical protein